jgi:heat shock protein HspQ
MTEEKSVKFTIGQVVHHKMFDYRGVVVDVDPVFNSSEEWYEQVAL